MALIKQPVSLNFAQGLETKTDPNQVALGRFARLQNMVFTTGKRLTKRNGFGLLTTLPSGANATTLTTLNDNLLATGSNLYAYNPESSTWYDKGNIQPVQLSVQPLVRNSASQSGADCAITSSGLACLVYMEGGQAYYQISDSVTGQQVVPRTALTSGAQNPKVVFLKNYFIIAYTYSNGGTPNLAARGIPVASPSTIGPVIQISSTVSSNTAAYDMATFSDAVYFAWNSSTSAIQLKYMRTDFAPSAVTTIAGATANLISVTADQTAGANAPIWVTWYQSSTTTLSTAAYIQYLNAQELAPTVISNSVTLSNVGTIAANSVLTVFLENANTYSYSPNALTNFVSTTTVSQSGTPPASPTIILRSVGLASKPFITSEGSIYTLVTYGPVGDTNSLKNSNQPTYFLIDAAGNIIMRLAYSNGGGYLTNHTLPNVSINDNTYYIPYQYADFLTTVNKLTATALPVNAIYTQTGINLAQFTINSTNQHSSEIASALHLTGGMLWEYDAVKPVEHGFHVWPENIAATVNSSGGALAPQKYYYQFCYEWTDNQGMLHRSAPSIPLLVDASVNSASVTTTASFSTGATSFTVASATGIAVGQLVTDTSNPTFISTSTYVTAVSGTTVTISQATVGTTPTGPGDTLVFSYAKQTTGTWTANASTITVASNAGLMVGQYLTDTTTSSSLQANTYITSISGTTIGISLPTVAAATNNVIQTVDIISNTINVPMLRLTYKTGLNPVRIVGYRWSVAQQNYYQFTSVSSPILNDPTVDSVTITDTLADQAILGNALIYTTGGVVEDIAAPACNISVLYQNRLWLVDAEDTNLLWYSKQVIEGVPVEMSDLLTLYVAPTTGSQGSTGPITALGAMDDKLIIFKRDAIYYVNGSGPDNTGANDNFSDPIFITSAVGCANQNSVVLMPNGLMFQSDKGIWLLGRDLSTNYIGDAVEGYNNNVVTSATSIPGTNQVRFILDSGIALVYDYYFAQWATFTTLSAVSATLYQSTHIYLNEFGQVLEETPGSYVDNSTPVLMGFTSSWINVAGLQGYQRFYFLYLLGKCFSPFTLNVQLAYDYNPSSYQNITVTPDNFSPAWGGDAQWGSASEWGGSSDVLRARLFPENGKCESFQITVDEVYDPSYGIAAGQGLALSGFNIVVGVKKGYRPQKASQSFG